MSFIEQVKYVNYAFLTTGVLGLIRLLVEWDLSFTGDKTDFDFSESSLNFGRSFLMLWEFAWLTVVALGFLYLARNAAGPADAEKETKVVNFEVKFLKIMGGVLLATAFLTMAIPAFYGDDSPIYQYRSSDGAIEIKVVAFTYGFTFDGNSTITLNTDTKYVFKLTTVDTTHGFGIYNENNQLVIQAQIIPNYTAELVMSFDNAGEYTIRCMEYCGVSHFEMEATITVV